MKQVANMVAIVLLVASAIVVGKLGKEMWQGGAGARGVRPHVEARVATAAERNERAARHAEEEMRAIFAEMRNNVPRFVEEITGIRTKCVMVWKGAKDLWPWQKDRARVRRMVEEKWNKCMLSPQDMKDRMEDILAGYGKALRAERNRLMVDVGEIMKDVNVQGKRTGVDVRRVCEEQFERALRPMLLKSLGSEVVSLVASEAAGVVMVNVVSVVMTRAGMLAAGGLSGAATFGIGLVVGLIVDWIISEYADAKMRQELIAQLTEMERLVMEGDGHGGMGMVAVLNGMAEAVSAAEREAVRKVVVMR